VALLVLLAGLCAGCETVENVSFTYKLWNNDLPSHSQPTANPELAVFTAPAHHDMVVEYNAISDKNLRVVRRAYFLAASQDQIARGHAPNYVSPGKVSGLQPIPNQVSTNEYVLAGKDGKTFTLFRANQPPESHSLPFYEDDHGTLSRVALTPVAVVGDAAIVGACGAVIAAIVLCEGNTAIH